MLRQLVRLLPHGSGNATHASGKFKPTPGSFIDVFVDSAECNQLTSNGWLRVALVGTTAQRPDAGNPNSIQSPTLYLDTTLGKLIVWEGTGWRDPMTGSAA